MSEKLSLETLPTIIQDSIFQYLQASELIKLTLLSESLYWAAAGQLYKSISVTDKESYELAQGHMDIWQVNCGTVLPYKRFEKLVNTLRFKPELGELVYKFTFHHRVKFGQKRLDSFLALTPHLSEFHNFSRFQIPQPTVEKLQRITCVLGQSLKHAKCLRELRVRDFHDNAFAFPEDDESEEEESGEADMSPLISDAAKYKQLAKDLMESGASSSLIKLHISSGQAVDEQDCFGQYQSELHSDNWLAFFAQLKSSKTKLDLDALAIHGVDRGSAEDAFRSIEGSVDLSGLKQLVLVHDDSRAHRPDESFLQLLTKNTPELVSLAVFLTSAYSKSELEIVQTVLEHQIPHQLKDLSISMNCINRMRARYGIQHDISEVQKNLVRVKINDRFPLVLDPNPYLPVRHDLDGDLEAIHESSDSDWLNELERQHFFPDVIADMHSRPALSDTTWAAIRRGMGKIKQCMASDLIYRDAQRKLPHLSQYYLGGVLFDMKNRGVFTNEHSVALNTPPAKVPAFVNLGLTERDMVEAAKDIAKHLEEYGPEAWKQVYDLLIRESELPPGKQEVLAGFTLDWSENFSWGYAVWTV